MHYIKVLDNNLDHKRLTITIIKVECNPSSEVRVVIFHRMCMFDRHMHMSSTCNTGKDYALATTIV